MHELRIWDFISRSDYEVPRPPTTETALGHSRRIWHWLKHDVLTQPTGNDSTEPTTLTTPSIGQLQAADIEPGWDQAAQVLSEDLNGWFDNRRDDCAVRVLVGPPGSGVASVLNALIRQRQLKVLSPPAASAILDDAESHKSVLQSMDESADDILVIPELERFYLRHEDGLNLVRKVAERLMFRRRVLIGCDSWAWAFLQQAIGIEYTAGKPKTAAPFDDQRLDYWFRSSYDLDRNEYRQSCDEKPVFPSPSEQSRSDEAEPRAETSDLIKALAARARGNLGVALALWCSCLRVRDLNSAETPPASQTSPGVYWVESRSELELPTLTADFDPLHRFVLHAILLHGGLSLSMLATVLPFSREDISRRVSELRTAGVLHEQNDTLRVMLVAYPAIRHELVSEGFLADAF